MSDAIVNWISGPVLKARSIQAFSINESVLVGKDALLGEVIRIRDEEIVIQVYEDTSGLRPGDSVTATGMPLSIHLGPALLGNIFDGLLRPLETDTRYIAPGMVQKRQEYRFQFTPCVKPGDQLTGSVRFGTIRSTRSKDQYALVPPNVSGEIIELAKAGEYSETATLCTLRGDQGELHEVSMSHAWPVRQPRPIQARLPSRKPLLSGQRILDSLFPLAAGSKAAMPGGFGTGKTVLQETLAKWCDADVIVYVGCGERGNEMAGVLHEFPELDDPHTGRPLMERTVIIANTSNMPVSAREASIYTAVTVGEYFRDQGLSVALMADSTSRWAEALREVSGRLGELPSEAGYPAYLSSRQADFYERAANVQTLNGEQGSLSIIGAVSPPSADFSEPVTTHTKRYVRCFWALDATRAQARFYPAVHPLLSYSEEVDAMTSFWIHQGHSRWPEIRRRFLTLLEQQTRLERMARIVGQDALPPRQQHILLCADLINDGFLRQSAFSDIDRYCSPARQAAMMKLIARFIHLSELAVANDVEVEHIRSLPILRRLRRMGEEVGEDQLAEFKKLRSQLDAAFTQLRTETADHEG